MAFIFSGFNLGLPSNYFSFNIELLESLIQQTENSIAANIEKFNTSGPETHEYDIDEEQGTFSVIDTYMGLDSSSVDLTEIFTQYFPSMMRRSTFLTIFGILEHEIDKFCSHHSKILNVPFSINDLRGSGFERAHLYIKKSIGLSRSTAYTELKKLIKLRNSCAHNDAKFKTNDDQDINEICSLMHDHADLFSQDSKQVQFNAGSLELLLTVFKQYIQEIERLIERN